LLNDRSKRIEKNYRGLATLKESHAEKDLTCLRCHATDAQAAAKGVATASDDGVSCERCHGPAEKWLGEHYLRGWEEKSIAEKAALGFFPTKDLVLRGRLCADCHVGSAGQDVDHDLIAAGHPRLNFEYAAYMAMLPAHWSRREERTRHPDLEARVWAIGQVVSAQMALELLAHRAATAAKPWPEFAEYDCYACHHDLKQPSPRQKRGYGDALPGSFPLSQWYYGMLPSALEAQPGGQDAKEIQAALAGLRKEMANPDRKRVAERALAAAQRLNQPLARWEQADPTALLDPRRLFDRVLRGEPKDLDANWDGATQDYLALAALHQAMRDLGPVPNEAQRRQVLLGLAERLQFLPGQDSPGDFDPTSFREQRDKLRNLLGR
jgi:hypothetical protein